MWTQQRDESKGRVDSASNDKGAAPCSAFECIRNDITIMRWRGPNPVAFFMPETLPVHVGCRVYCCVQCGATNPRPFRNGHDLQRWWRKHLASPNSRTELTRPAI
jgi:hypothetical protein